MGWLLISQLEARCHMVLGAALRSLFGFISEDGATATRRVQYSERIERTLSIKCVCLLRNCAMGMKLIERLDAMM